MKLVRVLLVAFCCSVLEPLRALVPQLINFQGRVAVDGVNFNGTGQFKFALVNGDGSVSFWSNDATSVGGSEPNDVEVTSPQVEAEVKRIDLETRAPMMLAEIKAALGNDPARFARAVAKPIAVERELRRRFENDDRLHGAQRKQMETAREQILALQRRRNPEATVLPTIMESLVAFGAQTGETALPTCCRRLAGSAYFRCVCRQDAGSTLRIMESTGGTISDVRWQLGPRPEEARSPYPSASPAAPLPVRECSSKYSLDATATFATTVSPAKPLNEQGRFKSGVGTGSSPTRWRRNNDARGRAVPAPVSEH